MNRSLHTLWYNHPAAHWNEALPLGNGRIGAMVFGGAEREILCLNEDTIWSGYPTFHNQPHARAALQQAKQLTASGNYLEAQQLLERDFTSKPTEHYLPLGNLTLAFAPLCEVSGYRRTLDLKTAVHTVTFSAQDVQYTRETLISAPDQVIAIRLTASQPGNITFSATLTSQLKTTCSVEGSRLILDGICPSTSLQRGLNQAHAKYCYEEDPAKQGIRFRAILSVQQEGGSLQQTENGLLVQNAHAATLYFAVRTSFNGWNRLPSLNGKPFREPCLQDILQAEQRGFDAVRAAHLADYQALYDRTELVLPASDCSTAPTDQRLIRHAAGEADPALYALLFHYGRYLTIAASRSGTQPMNLQGIWNHLMNPPWSSNYTININTEMNYWPTLSANLAECCEPLLTMLQDLRESGSRTAQAFYGAPGFCSHHNTDLWRLTTPVGNGQPGCGVYAFWQMSSGWLMRHAYEYWRYTGDADYLTRSLLPLLRDCAAFYLDQLEPIGDGTLILRTTTSPEHNFRLPDGSCCAVADWTTMTQSIVRDVFEMALEAAQAAGADGDDLQAIAAALPRLHGFEPTKTGAIREWNEDFTPGELHHRHLSHLYGLYPAQQILPGTPEADWARQTLLERGDQGTGWSLGWKINFWARLRDGEHALQLLDLQLMPCENDARYPTPGGSYPNLLDAHPPFQIDGNFGACSGILQMLLQGDAEHPDFLPALPSSWDSGSLRGARLPGGKTVDLQWKHGKLEQANIR